jgi:hypothetical protein
MRNHKRNTVKPTEEMVEAPIVAQKQWVLIGCPATKCRKLSRQPMPNTSDESPSK